MRVKITNGKWYAQTISGEFSVIRGFEKNKTSKKEGFIWISFEGGVRKIHVNKRDVVEIEVAQISEIVDPELPSIIATRFKVFEDLTHAIIEGHVKSLIVSGAPGIGKSHTLERLLRKADADEKIKLRVLHGKASAIGLYIALYKSSSKNSVLILDDLDIYDEDILNLLKAVLDTTGKREVSWLTMSNALQAEGIEQQFEFEGSVVFVTNTDFDAVIQKGNKLSPHLKALVDRSVYLDLFVHTPTQILVRIQTLVANGEFVKSLEISEEELLEIVDWMKENVSRLRSLSLRTVLHVANYKKMSKNGWKDIAAVSLLR